MEEELEKLTPHYASDKISYYCENCEKYFYSSLELDIEEEFCPKCKGDLCIIIVG